MLELPTWPFIATGDITQNQNRRSIPGTRCGYLEIQKKIGEELRERIELPNELPHQLLTALMQLNDQSGG